IKVDEKYGDNDQLLRGVIIHKKSAQGKNTTVTKAKRGELISKEDSNILQLVLYDGHHYEDIVSKDFLERQRVPFAKATFEKYIINMDLSGLVNIDLDSDSGENADGLLNVSELRYTIDSLKVQQKNDEISYTDNIHHRMTSVFQKDFQERQRAPFAKATFEKYIINMDLSGLVNIDLDSDSGENADGLLNVSELRYTIDSLKVQQKNDEISYTDNIHHRMTSVFQNLQKREVPRRDTINQLTVTPVFNAKNIIDIIPASQREKIYESAKVNMTGSKYSVAETKNNLEFRKRNIRSHQYSLYERFVVTYACLLMFFIGAPLGAIIRKGGFGLPIVFAIIIFIGYHFTTTFGRKIAQDGTIEAFWGAWGYSIVLTPPAINLT